MDDDQQKRGFLIRRFTALLIDFLLFSIYAVALFLVSPIVGPLFQKSAVQSEIVGFILLVVPVFLYFFLFEASHFKATPGKLLFKLNVIKVDGTNFSYKDSFIRSAIKFVPWEIAHFAIWQLVFPNSSFSYIAEILLIITNILLVIYIVFPFFNRKARAIYDYVVHTILVVR